MEIEYLIWLFGFSIWSLGACLKHEATMVLGLLIMFFCLGRIL